MTGAVSGFQVLRETGPLEPSDCLQAHHNQAFNQYIAIHKVLVGERGAARLIGLCMDLQDTTTPDHLVAAGWAAAEAAIVLGRDSPKLGGELCGMALESWKRAIAHQRWINAQDEHPLADYALPFRSAQDIATLPVFNDMATGGVRKKTLHNFFLDQLNIAQLNIVQLKVALASGCADAVGEHAGFGYEANAMLAYNRRLSGKWFALPAMARCDSGVYHEDQTHDIIVVHQRKGKIVEAVPVEIKSAASRKDRRRYASLLMRGKMHLSEPGNYLPEQTLEAITADYEGIASPGQSRVADSVKYTVYKMVGDYLEGERRRDVASHRTPTQFHHKDAVIRRHAGLAVD